VSLRELPDDLEKARNDPAGLDGEAEDLPGLPEKDAERDPVEESDEDRLASGPTMSWREVPKRA